MDRFQQTLPKLFLDQIVPSLVQLADQCNFFSCDDMSAMYLQENSNRCITLSKKKVACLLANVFLDRSPFASEFVNFRNLLDPEAPPVLKEKLKCYLNYFTRICQNPSQGYITIHRKSVVSSVPIWSNYHMKVTTAASFQDYTKPISKRSDPKKTIRMDYANKFIGGGALGRGAVQEEIMFAKRPELLLARMLNPSALNDKEAVIIIGAERYNNVTGYRDSFKWSSDYIDPTPLDALQRPNVTILAVDALCIAESNRAWQYHPKQINRELTKLWSGLSGENYYTTLLGGNWGCGVFNGDPTLKLLIQLIVCTIEDKELIYLAETNQQQLLMKILTKASQYTIHQLNAKIKNYYHSSRAIEFCDYFLNEST